MSNRTRFAVVVSVVVALVAGIARAETPVRIATYNIKFLDAAKLPTQGDRAEKLAAVIDLLDADLIALQEIDDRAALALAFAGTDGNWTFIIDDDSGNTQDVALAVRDTLRVVGVAADGDAEDDDFLFSDEDNHWFPNRRDVLAVEIEVPDEGQAFHVMVIHGKSRFDGRAHSDPRREGASVRLVQQLESRFDGMKYVVLGDFNDAPDDRSMNILETGDPDAAAGPEGDRGPFLWNLTESLWAAGHVSHGLKSNDVMANGRVDTIDPGARQRNNDLRGTNLNSGDILFDQILISPAMWGDYVGGSVTVFDHPPAVVGNNTTRASDHVPVYAEFLFTDEVPEPAPGGPLSIVGLLPNPAGDDRGHESVILRNNDAEHGVNLTGWWLRDRADNEFEFPAMMLGPGAEAEIVMAIASMPLNNSGDEVTLISPDGDAVQTVTYTGSQVDEGVTIRF